MPNSPERHSYPQIEKAKVNLKKEETKEYNQTKRTGQDFYNTRAWRRLSKWHKKANPLCVECKELGQIVPVAITDHIIPVKKGGARLDSNNLQSLCHLHHNQKTKREENESVIFVVIGPPCAGKSTYVREQQKINGGIIVDFDALALAFGSDGEHEASETIKQITLKARYAAIQEILKGIDTTAWIIETTPSSKMIQYYKEAGVRFKTIDPGRDICLERAAQRPEKTLDRINNWYLSPIKL